MGRSFLGSRALKGHGAVSNARSRFDDFKVEEISDGWYSEDEPPSIDEVVLPDSARTVISTNESPDVGFDASINPYRGCSHACVYCFARPTHTYLGLSAGRDFESRLFYKRNAPALLEEELSKPRYVCKPIALGINTDGYQPLEKRMQVTRGILSVLARSRHPVSIVTKSTLVLRDLDILAAMARDNLVSVTVSVTSLRDEIKRTLEPRAASPQARLRVIKELSQAHVPVGVLVAPVIPALTDHEMEDILQASRVAGAVSAGYVLLRLPHEVKTLFREWLDEHHPGRAAHVMSLINQSRGGKDYEATFGTRMTGTGPFAELMRRRFDIARRKLGFADEHRRQELATHLFRPPAKIPQLDLDI